MGFPKFEIAKYPIRQWAAYGFPGCGKSTFVARLRGPLLVVDADQRFAQTMREFKDRGLVVPAHRLSANPQDNASPSRIADLLDANMPGSQIGTVVVDSLTTIITPRVVKAIVDVDEGRENALASGWKKKALAMRQVQDAVTKWGTDCFWVWHLNRSRDAQGREEHVAETLSKTERLRLHRSLNMRLEFVEDGGKRGVKITWARYGRAGATIWDEPGKFWEGVPERIEAAAYDGLSPEERAAMEKEPPELFPDEETAIAWGFEQGPFNAVEHARNALDKLKRESGFEALKDLTPLWIADVERRIEEAGHEEEGKPGNGNGHTNGKATNGNGHTTNGATKAPPAPAEASPLPRPYDLTGVRHQLARLEEKHMHDRVYVDTAERKSLTNYRGLVLGKLSQYVHGEDPRHILIAAVEGTATGSGKEMPQARLSAYWEWMALRGEDVVGVDGRTKKEYLSTPETDLFLKEANAIIAAFRSDKGQEELPF